MKANILLVDDRAENLTALQAILEPLGHNLVAVGSGKAALKELLQHDFACILLDVQMPDLDGFETAELIKERDRTRRIPIVFLTAISKEEGHVFRGYSAGAVDYMFKPFDPDVLRSKVAVFVELWEKTEQLKRQAEQLREQELSALRRESEENYRQLADAMPQIVWTSGSNGAANYFNRRWFEYTGMHEDEVGPNAWLQVVHPDDLPNAVSRREQTLASGEIFEAEYRFRAADGTYRWHLGRAVPISDERGTSFWIGTATDIDDRKRTEEGQRFLLEAGAELASSLDYRKTLAAVSQLAVLQIADWCSVHLIEDDGSIVQLAVAHADPAKVKFALEVQERYPPDPASPSGVPAVIRSGRPELMREIPEELLTASAVDDLHLDLMRELGLHSWLCVPLTARGRTLGAISFVAAESRRNFGPEDLVLAQELARSASAAIDNAQLLRQAEGRAQAARVLAAIGDGVVLLDREGRVRLWNNAAEAITGLTKHDVLGRRAADAIPGWGTVASRLTVAAAGERASAESFPLELGGRELWLSISSVGFEDGTVYAFRDLTSDRALEELRQDLVATVSHELRTPLAAIYGSALTLRRDDVELELQLRDKLLEVIVEESERLSVIVNDLLLASQLDSGRLRMNVQRCDPRMLAETVVQAARTHTPAGVVLKLQAPKGLPAVEADPEQLRQVLANLIDNAVKYSPGGGQVNVKLEAQDGCLRFAISDRGLGIPVPEQRRIFEKFYRVDPQMTGGIGGTGLGLYISRELIRRVDGKIWVESKPDRGSTFFVEIPLARSSKVARPKAAAAA
ncbi:MAG: ATP-binding protein [Gaiellaceae bacterium]